MGIKNTSRTSKIVLIITSCPLSMMYVNSEISKRLDVTFKIIGVWAWPVLNGI